MTIADGFFFGVGFMGSLLVLILFVLVVTLITAFIGYISGKGKRHPRGPGRNNGRQDL